MRAILVFLVACALVAGAAANTVYINTGWFLPSPTQNVDSGSVTTGDGNVTWTFAVTCTNGFYTGTPHFNPRTVFKLYRVVGNSLLSVGTYTYYSNFYNVPEQFNGGYIGLPGTYYFHIYVEADQWDGLKYRDNMAFPWELARVTGW